MSNSNYLILQHTEYPVTFLMMDGYSSGESPEGRQYGLLFAKSEAGYRNTLSGFPGQIDARVYMPAKGISVYFRKCFLAQRMMQH